MKPSFFVHTVLSGFLLAVPAVFAQQRVTAVDSSLVGPVWSGHPVDFAFVAKGDTLYAAWYHGNTRQIVVAVKPPAGAWRSRTLTGAAATVGWDSHNSITLVVDGQGLLHLAGNMHNNPLRYWRSDVPGEIDSLKQVTSMVGTQETSVTYPVFVKALNGDLIFIHRDGGSGNGNHLINKWDPGTKTWSRLLSTNLFSGSSTSGMRSVYFGDNDAGPVAGPDGWYHLFWFWRATPDAGSTHRVSYIRSGNLTSWFTATGTAVTLPITFDNNPGVIVDNVPQFAGLINRGQIGFDSQNRPIITYHKHDSTVAGGYTQCYNARLENGSWVVYKTTNWPYRWSFGGGGSLVIQIQLGPVTRQPDGRLTQWYSHWQLGRGVMVLNEATLQPVQVLPDAYWPKPLDTAYRVVNSNSTQTANPLQMQVNWASVRSPSNPAVVHALRWETWPENADAARATSPPAGELMYYRMNDPNAVAIARPGRPRAGAVRTPALRVMDGRVIVLPDGDGPADLTGRMLPEPPAK
jgi:YD repeat-containing protein